MSVFVKQSYLFLAALWSPAEKGLAFCWLVCDVSLCFVTFLYGILGQVWYLIVSIPDSYCRIFLTLKFKGSDLC